MKRPGGIEDTRVDSKILRCQDETWECLPGMIDKVVLRHFMCHQEFIYSPTRRVNFLAGQNGSGKSAVLTGVLFCLGAKAKDLGKSSLRDLIREGSSSCSVEVSLCNRGENGYRTEEFGPLLVVIRTLSRSGGSTYKFKDSRGHLVPIKKPSRELTRILSAFSIQITNPVTILMQETAKTLLKDATEKKLYTFFMLASQLEDCKKFYSSANEKKLEAETRLEEKVGYKESLEKEYKKWKKEYDFLQSIESRRKDIKNMKAELAWSIVKELEGHEKTLERTSEGLNAKTQKYDKLIEDREETARELKLKKSEKDKELTHFKEIESSLQAEKASAKEVLLKAEAGLKTSSRKREDFNRRARDLDREISDLKTLVQRLKAQDVSETQEKRKSREAAKEALNDAIAAANRSIEKTIEGIEDRAREKRHEMSANKSKMEALKRRLKA
ncbi:Structural maintenance of chromosomes 6 [Caligus rogercresseyi]|uniref:Structural maintenance of chromosomes 6 n=1 Tax=Caligus rogercresseyi TaxID=217165 RepID=A0A7T8KJ66_CALRO|nr:Structural maintenance of chromosomes 6 [Caligus rogercresseyi]